MTISRKRELKASVYILSCVVSRIVSGRTLFNLYIYYIVYFKQKNSVEMDYEYFRDLALQYYKSDDRNALGNYINGQLDIAEK